MSADAESYLFAAVMVAAGLFLWFRPQDMRPSRQRDRDWSQHGAHSSTYAKAAGVLLPLFGIAFAAMVATA